MVSHSDAASADSPSSSSPSPIVTPTSLSDAIVGPLRTGLERVHRKMESAVQSQLGRCVLDRCKLVVRLGKLLFARPSGSRGDFLPSLPPFTAGALESSLNSLPGCSQHVQHLPKKAQRSLETGMPESLFQAMESIVMWRVGASACMRETYHIRVMDTEPKESEYRLICKPNPDGSGVILVKEAIQSAFECIASTAIIEENSKGGLHWPITQDFHVGMTDALSHRFRVTSVRHQRRLRVQSGGQVWKLSRVNGVDYDCGGGRLTNEAEFCLAAWRDVMKPKQEATDSTAPSPPSSLPSKPPPTSYSAASCFDSSLQQAAPQWTPDSILLDFPSLIDWLQQHLL
ncbi:unnamed protein product [Closterium sp. Yama58-4]|nr:unnamed protein product [Closterium sp. Yama58-4]